MNVLARFVGLGIIAAALACAAAAQPAKPKVPAGRDPGGVAIAIVGPGVDYTLPHVAARLARDGEGEIIGWDFADRDRRPFARCAAGEETSAACRVVQVVTQTNDVAGLRAVIVRVDAQRPQDLVDAVKMVASTPARIVLFMPEAALEARFLAEASTRHPSLLFVAAVSPDTARRPDLAALGNLVTVGEQQDGEAAAVIGRLTRALAGAPELDPSALKGFADRP